MNPVGDSRGVRNMTQNLVETRCSGNKSRIEKADGTRPCRRCDVALPPERAAIAGVRYCLPCAAVRRAEAQERKNARLRALRAERRKAQGVTPGPSTAAERPEFMDCVECGFRFAVGPIGVVPLFCSSACRESVRPQRVRARMSLPHEDDAAWEL